MRLGFASKLLREGVTACGTCQRVYAPGQTRAIRMGQHVSVKQPATGGGDSGMRLSRRRGRFEADALHRSPHNVAARILPHPLQTPHQMQLAVRKLFEKTEQD